MTALAGVIHFDQAKPFPRADVDRLFSAIAPYGREAKNSWERGGALLMRSLLRTTPEDRLDRQPVQSSRSGRVTVFDGRLDNREELAAALKVETPRLRLMADSALVSMALDAWQESAFNRFLGDFALAQWDPANRRLLLARDTVGYRPVFWHKGADFFAFGSLPRILFAFSSVPRALREDAMHDFLCLMPMAPQATLYESIHRLQPGQYLVLEDNRAEIHRYHRFGEQPTLRLKDPNEYVEGLHEYLARAVAVRLRAIGPLASELSSGFDSSTVTALAALEMQKAGQRLMAFTGVLPANKREGPAPAGYHRDEAPGASALASLYPNVDHILVESGGQSPLHRLQERIELTDRPVLNPSNTNWVHDVQQAVVDRGGRVLLNGWQGNLTISHDGRSILQSLWVRGRLLSWLRVVRAMRRHYRNVPRRWFIEFSVAPYVPASLWATYQRFSGSGVSIRDYSPVSAELQRHLRTTDRAKKSGHDLMYRGDPNGIRFRVNPLYRIEFSESCLGMNAVGLDPRSPTMDRQLIEYCLQIPEDIFLHEGQPQWPIRQLGKRLLPDEILRCRTRGYQGADWFDSATAARDDLQAELERFKRHESVARYLDLEELQRLLDEWPESSWERPEVEMSYRNKLLRGFSAGAFVRHVENDNR